MGGAPTSSTPPEPSAPPRPRRRHPPPARLRAPLGCLRARRGALAPDDRASLERVNSDFAGYVRFAGRFGVEAPARNTSGRPAPIGRLCAARVLLRARTGHGFGWSNEGKVVASGTAGRNFGMALQRLATRV